MTLRFIILWNIKRVLLLFVSLDIWCFCFFSRWTNGQVVVITIENKPLLLLCMEGGWAFLTATTDFLARVQLHVQEVGRARATCASCSRQWRRARGGAEERRGRGCVLMQRVWVNGSIRSNEQNSRTLGKNVDMTTCQEFRARCAVASENRRVQRKYSPRVTSYVGYCRSGSDRLRERVSLSRSHITRRTSHPARLHLLSISSAENMTGSEFSK